MDRNKFLFVIDWLMFFAFIGVFTTGLLKFPGLLSEYGISSSTINKIHEFSGLTLGIIALAHISLHFKWLMVMSKKYYKEGFFRKKVQTVQQTSFNQEASEN